MQNINNPFGKLPKIAKEIKALKAELKVPDFNVVIVNSTIPSTPLGSEFGIRIEPKVGPSVGKKTTAETKQQIKSLDDEYTRIQNLFEKNIKEKGAAARAAGVAILQGIPHVEQSDPSSPGVARKTRKSRKSRRHSRKRINLI